MSESSDSTAIDRLWNRLESRYGTVEVGCDCGVSTDTVEALQGSALTRRDVEAYREGNATVADLASTLDADVDPGSIADLDNLVEALERADGPGDRTTPGRS